MTRPLGDADHVVVVGAGLAGWRCCEALRREGYRGALTLLGAESHPPYDRPPLSKQVLVGAWPAEHTALTSPDRLAQVNATVRLGARAVALALDGPRVLLEDGSAVAGTHVIVATGAQPRRLALSAGDGVPTLRTIEDAARIGDAARALPAGATAVVIGGGFIGAEVATALRTIGLAPIVLEALARPLVTVLGDEVAGWLAHLPARAGVELRTNQRVSDVRTDGDGYVVEMADNTAIPAELVVLGVGVEPTTDWLVGSGLAVRDGLVVDAALRASDAVAAIGDVARFTWLHGPFAEEVRIEHWQCATDHAAELAAALVAGTREPITLVPYFWSDQYGKKIQMLGHPAPTDQVVRVHGDDDRWLALYSRDGVATGLVALGSPRALMLSRELVATHATVAAAMDAAPWQG